MECSARRRRRKNLFRTALDKLVGKHLENVYNFTVIYNNDGDNRLVNSAHNIAMDNNPEENIANTKDNIKDEPPKVPPRRKHRPSSQNSCKS